MDKLELDNSISVNKTDLNEFKLKFKKELISFLNHYYSQTVSVNDSVFQLKRMNIIRLYLIKSYKGRCHALGKPVKGQRTWSNAWSSFKSNLSLRFFISHTKSNLLKEKRVEKIDYKFLKKKYVTKKKKVGKSEKKKFIWI